MPDLREVFEMTTTKMGEPDVDAWHEQEQRQRKASRNKKIGAIAMAAVLVGVLVVLGLTTLVNDDTQSAGQGPNPPPEGAERQTLSIVDVGSGSATALMAPASASEFDVSFDGSRIAYIDLDENGDAQVFVMDVDGTDARQVTRGVGGVSDADHTGPFWSPDGSMIAYARDTSNGSQLFVVQVSSGVSTRVTQEAEGRVVGPGGWAPDGGSIVYSMPNAQINHFTAYSVDLDTGESTVAERFASSPTPSPDGARFAFNSWLRPDPLVQLVVTDADGSDRRVIARLENEDGYQRWSPDSTQIAYVEQTADGGSETYIYDLTSGETRFVTAGRIESWVDNTHILVS